MSVIYKLIRIGGGRRRRYRDAISDSQRRREWISEPDKRKEDISPPSEGDWTCNTPHMYPVKESTKGVWEACNDAVGEHDEDLCRDLEEQVSFLMLVAGLFLAVVTAFTVESYKWLKEDKEDKMSNLLVEVVRLLNTTSTQGTAQLPQPFTPNKRDVVVNQIWFLSMMLSLVAVVAGTFCLPWTSVFRRTYNMDKAISPAKALALRQLRFDGLVHWGVLQAPEVLLLIVQTSIVLFIIGLLYFLWGISHTAALPTIIVGGLSAIILYLANLLPFLQSLLGAIVPATLAIPHCPFKSPPAWFLQFFCVLLNSIWIIPFHKLFRWSWGDSLTQRISFWCDELHGLLTDYTWKRHDDVCRRAREWWGPQHGPSDYSHYYVRGIISATEILVSKPNTVEIIPHCISMIQRQFTDAETWELLVKKEKLSKAEKALLEDSAPQVSGVAAEDDGNPATHATHIKNLRWDFASALFFQYLVTHSQKLRRVLQRHRIELYIRIKNSGHLDISKDSNDHWDGPVGGSIECPITNEEDAQELPQDFRIQLLKCAKRLIGTGQFTDEDMLAAALVVSASVRVSAISAESLDGHFTGSQDKQLLMTEEHSIPAHGQDVAQTSKIIKPIGVTNHPSESRVIGNIGMVDSLEQQPGKNKVDSDSQPTESLAELCQIVQGKLYQLPPTSFRNLVSFYQTRRVLRLDSDPPSVIESSSSGNDGSV